MSVTPRTDALTAAGEETVSVSDAIDLCRELEREIRQKEFQLQDAEAKVFELQQLLPG